MAQKDKSNITGTQMAYYQLCHRKLWLFSHGLNMEHSSDLVAEGRLVQDFSYQQRAEKWQEIAVEGIKIDYFDAQRGILREVKKSSKREAAHLAQVKYYLFVLERNGIDCQYAVLEYPKLRQTETVYLEAADRQNFPLWENAIRRIVEQEN